MSLAMTVKGTPRKRAYPSGRSRADAPLYDRVLRYVREDADGCWLWTATIRQGTGYGHLVIDGRARHAHRVAYEAFVGEIPAGLQLDHLCRVRECVNPWHLEPVTPLVNTRRGHGNNSKDSCPSGHEYNAENTYIRGGRRYCHTCRAAYRAAYRAMTPQEREARKAAGLPVVDLAAHLVKNVEAA